jgi:hypothetical protein
MNKFKNVAIRVVAVAFAIVACVILTPSAAPAADGQPTIGVPARFSYRVVSSREIVKAHVGCGFNDLSLSNGGIFRRETRQNYEYMNGRFNPVGKAYEVDVFLRCHKI